jgi:hypothetical protein
MELSVWGYNLATLFRGYIDTGTWPSRLGRVESETVKCDHVSHRLRPENDCAGEAQQQSYTTDPFFSQRGCYIRAMTASVQLKKCWS